MISTNALKPQSFKLADRKLSYTRYLDELQNEINNLNKRNTLGETGIFIDLLVKFHLGNIRETELTSYFMKNKSSIDKSKINKDFGETIGPLGCYTNKLFPKMMSNSTVFFPSRPNEPLMDYSIDGYIISAKSGTTTNTVKTHDILNLLENDGSWKNSLQYELFEVLIKYPTLHGSIAALYYLSNNGFSKLKGIDIKDILSKKKDSSIVDLDQHSKFIEKNASSRIKDNIKKGKPTTLNEFMYCCDIILQELSQKDSKLNFTDIFKAAIDKKVYYVKFELESNGLPSWELITADDIVNHRPYLRSKNANQGCKDKIGIQL